MIDQKKVINTLRKANNKLKVKLKYTKTECEKKSKLLQDLVNRLNNGGTTLEIPQVHKEASIVTSLKNQIQKAEAENDKLKKFIGNLQQKINYTDKVSV